MGRRIRGLYFLWVIMGVAGMVFLTWTFWSPQVSMRDVVCQGCQPFEGEIGLTEVRTIHLTWPNWTAKNGQADIRMQLAPEGQLSNGDEIYKTYNVVAEGFLDVPGSVVEPSDTIFEPMRPGVPRTFNWSVVVNQSGPTQARIWLYLNFEPTAGGDSVRRLVSVQDFSLTGASFLGAGETLSRLLGLLFMAFSLIGIFWTWYNLRKVDKKYPNKGNK